MKTAPSYRVTTTLGHIGVPMMRGYPFSTPSRETKETKESKCEAAPGETKRKINLEEYGFGTVYSYPIGTARDSEISCIHDLLSSGSSNVGRQIHLLYDLLPDDRAREIFLRVLHTEVSAVRNDKVTRLQEAQNFLRCQLASKQFARLVQGIKRKCPEVKSLSGSCKRFATCAQ